MSSRLREHFGTAGLVVAIVALVAALGGGAYAATGGSGGHATASAKQGKQGKQGKPGKTGPAGPAGPAGATGPAGPAGAKGDTGAAGTNGTNGINGSNGTSPTGTSFTGSKTVGSVTCTEGGTEYKGATTNLVCNGKEGEEGSPWTVGGTLPSEATETGTFFVKGEHKTSQTAPIGWSIPLSPADAAQITQAKIHVVGANGGGTCDGTAEAPTAPAGELCLYEWGGEGQPFTQGFSVVEMGPLDPEAGEFPGFGVSTAGALIYSEEAEWATSSWVQGSFAITAP
ncbi:MAG TPA: hypothetical protein VH275_03365 [Solirubrobacterales bacterium]|jgi:hypothetical protein|nr:hypothetical protein [Solirubrobacterales bacterium]